MTSLLSIGNGNLGVIVSPLNGDELEFYKVMRDVVHDCTKVAQEIKQRIGRAGVYFRFSVEQGMQNAHAADAMDPAWIVTQTESYLELEDSTDQLETFVKNNKMPLNIVTLNQLSASYRFPRLILALTGFRIRRCSSCIGSTTHGPRAYGYASHLEDT